MRRALYLVGLNTVSCVVFYGVCFRTINQSPPLYPGCVDKLDLAGIATQLRQDYASNMLKKEFSNIKTPINKF